MAVAKSTPKAKEIAIGMNMKVSGSVSVIRGIRPTNVVTDVRMIGRNRTTPAFATASKISTPCRL